MFTFDFMTFSHQTLLLPGIILSFLSMGTIQASQTNGMATNAEVSNIAEARSNMLKAEVTCITMGEPRRVEVSVQIAVNRNLDNRSFFENNELRRYDPSGHGFIYHMATNSFCGPLELIGPNGRKVSLLKPNVNSQRAYPAFYHLSTAHKLLMSGVNVYHGPSLPQPILGPDMTIASFCLNDYFELKKAGRYKLTIRPKIYKRESPTNDICRQIDIPPVTATINWRGTAHK